jgi:hypothetical protein
MKRPKTSIGVRAGGALAGACLALCAGQAAVAQAAPVQPANAADAALVKAVDGYARGLGRPRNATVAVNGAALPPAVASALADELDQLHACDVITRAQVNAGFAMFDRITGGHTGLPLGVPAVFPFPVQTQGSTVLGFPVPPAANPPRRPEYPFEGAVEKCGAAVVTKLDAVRSAVSGAHLKPSQSIDVWPVLRFQPGDGHHTYVNDYVLLVDTGSYNTFLNNAGGNAIDTWRGPAGQKAPITAPARGCIDAFDIIRSRTCAIASAALLDLGGHNTYGEKTAPDPATDDMCTTSPIESRNFVQGTGVLGVGVLEDYGSYNTFTGKVLTTGTGHVGGYGYLRVDGDHNTFSVIRDGLGDAVVGGTGYLIVNGSYNSYSTYSAAPINPFAAAGTLGSGGVVDDLNNCDAGAGTTLGAGEVAGVGHFVAVGAHNTYAAPQDSLGSGLVAGAGTFSSTGSGATNGYTGPGVTGGRGTGATVDRTSTNNGTFLDS